MMDCRFIRAASQWLERPEARIISNTVAMCMKAVSRGGGVGNERDVEIVKDDPGPCVTCRLMRISYEWGRGIVLVIHNRCRCGPLLRRAAI